MIKKFADHTHTHNNFNQKKCMLVYLGRFDKVRYAMPKGFFGDVEE